MIQFFNCQSHNTQLYEYILVEVERNRVVNLPFCKISKSNFKISNHAELIWYNNDTIV